MVMSGPVKMGGSVPINDQIVMSCPVVISGPVEIRWTSQPGVASLIPSSSTPI